MQTPDHAAYPKPISYRRKLRPPAETGVLIGTDLACRLFAILILRDCMLDMSTEVLRTVKIALASAATYRQQGSAQKLMPNVYIAPCGC